MAAPPEDWHVEGFVASLTSLAPSSRTAYRGDVTAFVTWAIAVSSPPLAGPADVDRRVVRRYLAHLASATGDRPPCKPRTIARNLSSLRRWFAWLRRHDLVAGDPTAGLSAPGGDPRVFRVDGSEIALRRETARRLTIRATACART